MSQWLLTVKCAPAWWAVLHLLDDREWHPRSDVEQAMRDAADLAPYTIHRHLKAASQLGWIRCRRGRVRLGPTPPADLTPHDGPPPVRPCPVRVPVRVPAGVTDVRVPCPPPSGDTDGHDRVPEHGSSVSRADSEGARDAR